MRWAHFSMASPPISWTLDSTVCTSIFFWPWPYNQRSIYIVSIYRLHQGGLSDEVASSNAGASYPTHRMIFKKAPSSQSKHQRFSSVRCECLNVRLDLMMTATQSSFRALPRQPRSPQRLSSRQWHTNIALLRQIVLTIIINCYFVSVTAALRRQEQHTSPTSKRN